MKKLTSYSSLQNLKSCHHGRCRGERLSRLNLLRFLACFALVGICGCGTPDHLPEYSRAAVTSNSAINRIKTVQQGGATVSLEPFDDKTRCETYFDLNAPAAGIAIFHLRVENSSSDTSWLLRKAQCRLSLSGSDSALGDANTARSTGAGEAMALTGAALMGLATTPILIGLGSHQVKQASTVQRNFTEKELRDKSIPPSQSTEGFIYYHMPQKNTSFQGTLQVSLISTQNQQTNTLQIPIDYEVK